MQQHLMQMQPMMSAYYPNNITTDVIQQYLDENKSLILKIVESQNLGKLSECAESQARLQRNLMYLAAIADAQPQPPSMHSQYPSGSMMQPGGNNYLQHQQAQSMTSQALMAARSSMLYNQQHQQALHSHLGLSSGRSSYGLSMLQMDANNGGGFPDFSCGPGGGIGDGGSKQDISGSTEG